MSSLVDELLGPLHMHFAAALVAYGHYLEQGRSFLFASSLKRINIGIRALLLGKGHLLPDDMQRDAVSLVSLYDAWLTYWEDLADRMRPEPDDPFVFENRFTYPKDAEQRLETLYRERGGR